MALRQTSTKLSIGSRTWKAPAQARASAISVAFRCPLSAVFSLSCVWIADFDLSANRHRPLSRAKVEHRDPLGILEELRGIGTQILGEIDELTEAARGATEK